MLLSLVALLLGAKSKTEMESVTCNAVTEVVNYNTLSLLQ